MHWSYCSLALSHRYDVKELGPGSTFGSGNGLLPHSTLLLPEPLFISHWWNFLSFIQTMQKLFSFHASNNNRNLFFILDGFLWENCWHKICYQLYTIHMQSVPKTIELTGHLGQWQALIYWPKPGFTGPNNWHNTLSTKFPHASQASGRALFTGPIGNWLANGIRPVLISQTAHVYRQTPQKLLGFYRTKEGFWPDFADTKHDYTQEIYRSYSFFFSKCPRTG